MVAGRPRSSSFSPEDMISLGEEMIKWIEENNPIHLSQFYCVHKKLTDKEWDAMRKVPEFLHYYEQALKMVGYQYLEKESRIDPSLKHRWTRVYFKDIKEAENEDLRYKNQLAIELAEAVEKMKSQNGNVPPEIQSKVEELFSTISAHQSVRKMACSSNNTESKSVCETGESSTCRGNES